jgi:hypothetical protein
MREMLRTFEVTNEEQAWQAFFALTESLENDDDDGPVIKITDWTDFVFILRGENYKGTFTSESVTFTKDLQNALYRAYALIKHGRYDIGVLTEKEKDELKIKFRIEEGSSKHIADKDTFLHFAQSLLDGLSSKQKYKLAQILIVGTLLMLTGTSVLSNILEERRIARLEASTENITKDYLDHLKFADQQQTIRMGKMVDLAMKNADVSKVLAESYGISDSILKAAKHADESTISGNVLSQDVARELTKKIQDMPKQARLDGLYRITKIGDPAKDSSEFFINVESVDGVYKFSAILDTRHVPSQDKDQIFLSLKNKEDAVYLVVNARVSKGKILNAFVVSAKRPDQIETASGNNRPQNREKNE